MNYPLFSTENAYDYFESNLKSVKAAIERMTDDEIAGSELSEWEEYYYQQNKAHLIELFDSSMTQTIEETKIKQSNPFRDFDDEPDFYYVNGIKILYKIPFNGDCILLKLKPSTYYLNTLYCEAVVAPTKNECGFILYGKEFANGVLDQHPDDMSQFVSDSFEQSFSYYRNMIRNINSDAESYNERLRSDIKDLLEERKKRAATIALISKKLEIPLKMAPNAPNTKPIVLKQRPKPVAHKPTRKAVPPEYCISDKDYSNINNIIYMCGSSMEKTARSYITNDEEELRDIILATLDTHYVGATGETFRKIGKTDIQILFENQAAFIGECKIWHGEKAFADAIQQLFNYSTWKDIKVSLIIFNKHNKNFQAVLSNVGSWISSNTKSHTKAAANSWDCVYYRKDSEVDVKLHVVVFDLYVNQTQVG